MLTAAVTMTTVLPVSAATVSEGAAESQESSQNWQKKYKNLLNTKIIKKQGKQFCQIQI